jgi:hypothetical protein
MYFIIKSHLEGTSFPKILHYEIEKKRDYDLPTPCDICMYDYLIIVLSVALVGQSIQIIDPFALGMPQQN